MGERRNKILVG